MGKQGSGAGNAGLWWRGFEKSAKCNAEKESERMKALKLLGTMILLLAWAGLLAGQDRKAVNEAAGAPNLVLLVHQEIQPGRGSERQKLEAATARACDLMEAPSYWVELQALTGAREELFFDPFDNFQQLEEAEAGWRQFYGGHPDLGHMQEEIDGVVESERKIVAVRRDDLGFNVANLDLSEMRYMRVQEVRLFPGHEGDFGEALRILEDASAKVKGETPWMVYEVNVGMPSPAYLLMIPMSGLEKNDDLLEAKDKLLEVEGEEAAQRLEQIARESFASTESNLYEVRPEMSHVPKEWAAGDPEFWRPRRDQEAKPQAKPSVKPSKNRV